MTPWCGLAMHGAIAGPALPPSPGARLTGSASFCNLPDVTRYRVQLQTVEPRDLTPYQKTSGARLPGGLLNPITVRLSVMMFLQFFIWGGWFVTLGTFLGATFSAPGGEIGQAYSTQSWGAIIAPFIIAATSLKNW